MKKSQVITITTMSQAGAMTEMVLTSLLYAVASVGIPALMLVNPGGVPLVNDTWKLILMTGLMPALIKFTSVSGSAQLSVSFIMAGAALMVGIVSLLKMNKGYKTAMEKPGKAGDRQTVIFAWVGTFLLHAFVMFGVQVGGEAMGFARIEGAAPPAAPAAQPMI